MRFFSNFFHLNPQWWVSRKNDRNKKIQSLNAISLTLKDHILIIVYSNNLLGSRILWKLRGFHLWRWMKTNASFRSHDAQISMTQDEKVYTKKQFWLISVSCRGSQYPVSVFVQPLKPIKGENRYKNDRMGSYEPKKTTNTSPFYIL